MVVIYPTTPVVEFTSYMLTWTSLPGSCLCTRTETFPQKLKEVLLVEWPSSSLKMTESNAKRGVSLEGCTTAPRRRASLTLPLEKSWRPMLTQDSAVGTTSAAASFSCDGGGDGDDEALERSTQRRRRRVGRGEMKAGVWRVRLEIAAPPPPDRGESWGRGAAATAAIAEREGKCEVIVFLVILTGVFHRFRSRP